MGILNKAIPILLLFGCSATTPTNTIIDDSRQEVQNIVEEFRKLPKECQTKEIEDRLLSVSGRLDAAHETHVLELEKCELELSKSKNINYGFLLGLIVAAYLWLKKKSLV